MIEAMEKRSQQTLKKWLRAQPVSRPPSTSCRPSWTPSPTSTTTAGLTDPYPTGPPRQRSTSPCPRPCPAEPRRRYPRPGPPRQGQQDRNVTLRVHGKLRHIGIGRTHKGTHVILLVQDLDVRVINAITGELLRELTINPDKDYQPRGTK